MKSSISLAALAALVPFVMADPQGQTYTLESIRSGSPIQYAPVKAASGSMVLGGSSSPDCGPQDDRSPTCSPNSSTNVNFANDGECYLAITGTGFQQVYINATGALSYSTAHSDYVPGVGQGSLTKSFTTSPGVISGYSRVSFNGLGENSWVACPTANGNYQVYANVTGAQISNDCLGFDMAAIPVNGSDVFSY